MRKVIPDSDMCSIPAASVNGSGLHSVQRVRDAGEFLMIIIRSAKGRRSRPEKRKSLRRLFAKNAVRGAFASQTAFLNCCVVLLFDFVRSLCDIKQDLFACRKLLDRVHEPCLRNAGCDCVVDCRGIIYRKDLIDGIHVN